MQQDAPNRVGTGVVLLVVVLAGALPFLPWLASPFLSDDGAILGYVHRHPAGSDLAGAQFGMHAVRFWRPLVTLSWDLQEHWWGASPAPFRGLNLLVHLLGAVLAAGIARRLGLGRAAQLLSGLSVAWFAHAGGTVVWVAGRTDVFVTALLLAGVAAALGPRPRVGLAWASAWMLLAAATKETGFVLPAWVGAFVWARDGRVGTALRALAPVALAAAVGLVLRRWALGAWVGGYPHEGGVGELLGSLPAVALVWARALGPALVGSVVVVALGRRAGSLHVRAAVAGLVAALAAALPLQPLLVDGTLEATNLRLLAPSWAGLALALGAAVGSASSAAEGAASRRRALLVAGTAAIVLAGVAATLDARAWGRAAERAGARFAALREAAATWVAHPDVVAEGAGRELPALATDLPGVDGGAYLFAYGVADRFRAPFPASPVEVWPDRPLFGFADSVRPANRPHVEAPGPLRWPALAVEAPGAADRPLLLDERALEDGGGSPELRVTDVAALAKADGFEVVLYTPSGYEVATDLVPTVDAGGARLDLRALLRARGARFSLAQAWLQAVDFGAERAYLELRLLAAGEPIAVSPWLELRWSPTLPAAVARASGYE